jgi:hypothetical protein
MLFERRTMTYYHLAQWRDDSIHIGQIYATPLAQSEYWKRQLNPQANVVAMAKGFEDIQLQLGASTVHIKISEQQAQAYAFLKAQAQLKKEQIYEEVRRNEFPLKPSRQTCMFLCESEAQSSETAIKYGFATPPYRMFELECISIEEHLTEDKLEAMSMSKDVFEEMREPNRHRGNPDFLVCNICSDTVIEDMARKYWRGENTSSEFLTEVLFRGLFRVLRVVG